MNTQLDLSGQPEQALGVAPAWREIPGFRRYKVSSDGRVIGRGGNTLSLEQKRGYLSLKLWSDEGRRIRMGVHQLVAMAFIGPRPSPLHQAAHWDGDPANNCSSNVRWATPAENNADKVRHGTHQAGEKHPQRKLSAEQVDAIRSRWVPRKVGLAAELAAEFGLTKKGVLKITAGRTWNNGQR